MPTSDTIQGLIAQGRTIAETLEIARDVAKKLLEAQAENEMISLVPISDSFTYPLIIVRAKNNRAVSERNCETEGDVRVKAILSPAGSSMKKTPSGKSALRSSAADRARDLRWQIASDHTSTIKN